MDLAQFAARNFSRVCMTEYYDICSNNNNNKKNDARSGYVLCDEFFRKNCSLTILKLKTVWSNLDTLRRYNFFICHIFYVSNRVFIFAKHSCTLIFHRGTDQRKHQSSALLAFVWGIHRWPVNSPRKWPVTRKMFPSYDVIMLFTLYDGYSPASFSHTFSYAEFILCRYRLNRVLETVELSVIWDATMLTSRHCSRICKNSVIMIIF